MTAAPKHKALLLGPDEHILGIVTEPPYGGLLKA